MTDPFGRPCKCGCHSRADVPPPRPGCGHTSGIHDESCDLARHDHDEEDDDA
jgi:hypothetical protein